MGAGYFFGLMPRDLMAESKLAGVELDPITGAIARYLYPDASINIKGFQDVKIADGFYDLTIGNVPFGDFKVHDPEYNQYRANIHDYFILKSLDKTREGGVVAVITSTGTMDKVDARIRREIAARAELVAAMRFPDTAFKANAGTEVVTDLLIFRKRAAGEKANLGQRPVWLRDERGVSGTTVKNLELTVLPYGKGQYEAFTYNPADIAEINAAEPKAIGVFNSEDEARAAAETAAGVKKASDLPDAYWTEVGELPDPDGGEAIPISNYFVRHPEMILGRLDRKSKLYGGNSPHVSGTEDFEERLEKAIQSLPENAFGERTGIVTEPTAIADAVRDNTIEGGYVIRDGKVLQRQGDIYIAPQFAPEDAKRALRLVQVRDALTELNSAQLKGGDTAKAREQLNRAYNSFVDFHGPIRKAGNAKPLAEDPSSYLLFALEKSYDPKKQKAVKSDIFTKDTIARGRTVGDTSTPASAVAVTLFESGKVDLDRIAELLKTTPEEAAKRIVADGVAFENPRGDQKILRFTLNQSGYRI